MRPPICAICKKRFAPSDGGKVYFKETEEQKEYNKRFDEPGFVGHPSHLEWFCEDHIEAAKELKNLSSTEAIKELKKD